MSDQLPSTSTATRVDFNPEVCGGLIYLSSSPVERVALRRLNPYVDLDRWAGVALVVVLHEAHHATGDRDEARPARSQPTREGVEA